MCDGEREGKRERVYVWVCVHMLKIQCALMRHTVQTAVSAWVGNHGNCLGLLDMWKATEEERESENQDVSLSYFDQE